MQCNMAWNAFASRHICLEGVRQPSWSGSRMHSFFCVFIVLCSGSFLRSTRVYPAAEAALNSADSCAASGSKASRSNAQTMLAFMRARTQCMRLRLVPPPRLLLPMPSRPLGTRLGGGNFGTVFVAGAVRPQCTCERNLFLQREAGWQQRGCPWQMPTK